MSEPTRGPGCLDPGEAAGLIGAPRALLEEAAAYGEIYDKPVVIVYRPCSGGGCLLYGGVYRLCLGIEGVYGLEFVGYMYLCPCSIVSDVPVDVVVAVHSYAGRCLLVLDETLGDRCGGEGSFSWYYLASDSIEEAADELLGLGLSAGREG